jgi:hypothetical protein
MCSLRYRSRFIKSQRRTSAPSGPQVSWQFTGDDMTAPQSWESKCAALEDAFRKLQNRRGEAAQGIPYEFLIPSFGPQLMVMVPNPRKKALPPKKALRSLTRSIGQTIEALDRLPGPVLDSLNYRPAALYNLQMQLRILHVAVKTAEVETRRSAPTKTQEQKIARVVAQHYFALTGKKPTVSVSVKDGNSSPFVELLTAVYRTLGVKASAASQAKMVADKWPSIAANFPGI